MKSSVSGEIQIAFDYESIPAPSMFRYVDCTYIKLNEEYVIPLDSRLLMKSERIRQPLAHKMDSYVVLRTW